MIGFPKPESRLLDRIEQKRAREKRLADFKKAVWQRDQGHCRHCLHRVHRSVELEANRGEVHHLLSRRYGLKRYDVSNGVLLCAICHMKVTQRRLYILGSNANESLRFVTEPSVTTT